LTAVMKQLVDRSGMPDLRRDLSNADYIVGAR
jgi:hypothetical protein